MADNDIHDTTRAALSALAEAEGLTLDDYLARVVDEKERDQALANGAAAFRRVTGDPATRAAFDTEFTPHRRTSRAA